MPHPRTPDPITTLAALITTLSACGTLTSARPLDPGQHTVGLTLGGPLISVGGTVLPLPGAVLQGRSGLPHLAGRPLDVDYGLNLTGLAFGLAAVHGGVSWLALEQDGGMPALSLSNRLFVVDNHLDLSKDAEHRSIHGVDQLELTASWETRPALVYLGLAEYLDLREPGLLLSPSVGASWRLGRGWALQTEVRHYAVNRVNRQNSFDWVSWGPGALGGTLSVGRRLGEEAP